ncbi:hypothetical protein FDJ20_gp200 [Vibrio phage Thalassa]|uniref:Uncharacterized protein n=2 Tax=Thalassavirus TaxID=2948922 RepID=A0A2H5BH31_9CAUD|nr:hypothetical protein FDJ20_gp200 [Vibrio phage Thalassa]YP_010107946.1 hypothetical protein KNV05_gp195 [Vibrio phage River4]AUG85302.1 hypothetical protein THALASSA_109 [Vibrio phage Thalassa]QKN84760.1 hypothetical protein RIVER4_108 [Vibrio phage River4]
MEEFYKAALLMKKYCKGYWHTDSAISPIVNEEHFKNLVPGTPISDALIEEYNKVKEHPYKRPKIRHILQQIIADDILTYKI